MIKKNFADLYFVRSSYEGTSLSLEAVFNDEEVDFVFHHFKKEVKNEYEAELLRGVYVQFLAEGDRALKLMALFMANYFGVEYIGKPLQETVELINTKVQKIQSRLNLKLGS